MSAARILVVDDDENARRLLNLFLSGHCYQVAYAAGAYGAIAAARDQRPDPILLDFGLPGGDALVVLGRARNIAELAAVPVVVITARDREPHEALALGAGAVAFLQKRFDPGELLATITQALEPPSRLGAKDHAAIFRPTPAA